MQMNRRLRISKLIHFYPQLDKNKILYFRSICSTEESQAHFMKFSEIIEDKGGKTAIGDYSYIYMNIILHS